MIFSYNCSKQCAKYRSENLYNFPIVYYSMLSRRGSHGFPNYDGIFARTAESVNNADQRTLSVRFSGVCREIGESSLLRFLSQCLWFVKNN